jgi:hypothetical protein
MTHTIADLRFQISNQISNLWEAARRGSERGFVTEIRVKRKLHSGGDSTASSPQEMQNLAVGNAHGSLPVFSSLTTFRLVFVAMVVFGKLESWRLRSLA